MPDRGPGSSLRAAVVLITTVTRSAGKPAALRAAPVYAALAIVASVLFGKNGIYPKDVVAAADQFAGVRLGLWAGWLVALTPAARALLAAERLAYLRWLPVSRGWILATWTALLLGLELPWLILWWAGGDPATGLALWMLTAAGHACLARPARSARDRVITAAALAGMVALVLVAPRALHPAWTFAAAAAGLTLALPRTWTHGLEHVAVSMRTRLPTRPVLALMAIYIRGLLRTRGSILVRALSLIVLGAGFTTLVRDANDLDPAGLASFSAVITTILFPLALGGLIAPMLDTERALGWLLDSTATPGDTRIAARTLAAGGLAAGYGVIYGGLVTWWAGLPAALAGRVALGAVAMAIAMALIALRAARWAERGVERRGQRDGERPGVDIDGNRVVVAMVGAILGSLMAIGWLGDLAIAMLTAVALAVVWEKTP